MSFNPDFIITNRMTQAITRIERTHAVTKLSSYMSSLLRVQRRGVQE